MPQVTKRRNAEILRWLRAVTFTVLTGWALTSMSFGPGAAALGIALIIGVIALFAPGIAVLVSIVAMGIPLLAANLLTGALFLVVGFAAVQYLGQDNGRAFIAIAGTFLAARFGAMWAVLAVAGYVMGASEGAVIAILACLALEAAGLVTGVASMGLVHAGGTTPAVVSFDDAPANLLTFSWLKASIDGLDVNALLRVLTDAPAKSLLVIQPVTWAIGAAVAGLLKRPADDKRRKVFGLIAAAASVVTFAAISFFSLRAFAPDAPQAGALVSAAAISLVGAVAFVAAWEWLFPPLARRTVQATRPGTMSTEDADVDELLRLIATAEDQLTSKHTSTRVVMITDMKSFSKMTEEDGSVLSAKAIQRHRDLLLPVIERHGGSGKSTGGDGLVAAFEKHADAVSAAAEMQRLLAEYNATHSSERDIIVRIGIAEGEVVLDKSGRPFIGNALNLAARVMNLADGGQVFLIGSVATASGEPDGVVFASHGAFQLKNIAEPVEVVEALWAEGQTPLSPLGSQD